MARNDVSRPGENLIPPEEKADISFEPTQILEEEGVSAEKPATEGSEEIEFLKAQLQAQKAELSTLKELLESMRGQARQSEVEGNAHSDPECPVNYLPDRLVQAQRVFKQRSARGSGPLFDTEKAETVEFEKRTLNTRGPAEEALSPLTVDSDVFMVDGKKWTPEKLEREAFMHDMVLILVDQTTDVTEPQIFESSNGGQIQYFKRGEKQWVQRKFLEPLLRAKITRYEERLEEVKGDPTYVHYPVTNTLYQLKILKDPAGDKGRQWAEECMRAPV